MHGEVYNKVKAQKFKLVHRASTYTSRLLSNKGCIPRKWERPKKW